ncbi:response regulator [Candidatus Poribacteria bacterium]|nr:response regulator [Candidatus Poribacteria bacterium]
MGQVDRDHSSNDPALMCVDDEANVLSSLLRVFDGEGYRVLLASNGEDALSVLERQEVAIVLTDLNMPGMSGIELLKHVKTKSPLAVRMMLTAEADLEAAMQAINYGEVFRFIVKPWCEPELKNAVAQAFNLYHVCAENQRLTELTLEQNKLLEDWNSRLKEEVKKQTASILDKNQELEGLYRQLEGNFVDTIKTFAALLDMHDPETCSHSRRVTRASRFIADKLGIEGEELRTLEIAAMLHDVGKIGIPDTILRKPPYALTRIEKEILQKHPVLGENCVQSITRLCDAGRLIRHHHEHFAGGGYPDRISGEVIPLGSRIIAVADAFDRELHPQGQGHEVSVREALKQMRSQTGSLFDPRVVNALIPFVYEESNKANGSVEVGIPISSLKVGMVLTRNVVTGSGILLIAKGETLTPVYVERIKNYARIDPSMAKLYIYQRMNNADDGPEGDNVLLEVEKDG